LTTKRPLHFLDALRGLAALYVMIGHAKWLLWEGYVRGFQQHPDQYSFFEKILMYGLSAFRYGHQAVLFFFVLSGFVIHLKYARNIATTGITEFNARDYFIKRIRRIYPAFLLAILITFILDSIGSQLNYTIYNGTTPDNLINEIVPKQHDLLNFVGNLFFIQNEHIGVWGTNGPSWSLKYEWWFYMLYPVLVYLNKTSALKSSLLVILLFVSAIVIEPRTAPSFTIAVCKYLLIWWLGMLLADIYHKRIAVKHFPLSFFALLLPLLIVAETKSIDISFFPNDFLWSVGFFGLLNLFFYLQQKGFAFSWAKKIQWLGDCSYTLYIIHFPIIVFLNGILLHYTNNVMPKTMAFIFPGILLCLVLAYLLHFIVEKPFISKRA
jgi:peptidoglycan/LPS O-acetylase OafA/YrhL